VKNLSEYLIENINYIISGEKFIETNKTLEQFIDEADEKFFEETLTDKIAQARKVKSWRSIYDCFMNYGLKDGDVLCLRISKTDKNTGLKSNPRKGIVIQPIYTNHGVFYYSDAETAILCSLDGLYLPTTMNIKDQIKEIPKYLKENSKKIKERKFDLLKYL
jgi:hypothetical protein